LFKQKALLNSALLNSDLGVAVSRPAGGRRNNVKPKSNYGIDSPYIIAGEFIAGAVFIAAALVFPHLFGLPARWLGLGVGFLALSSAAGMIHYSKVGKLRIRDELLDSIKWSGNETVLDIGCGRGLLLVGAARRLTTGKATGIDVWLPKALTGNLAQAVLENAAIEGVAERIDVKEGDARKLPFADGSFDVVVSNFVLHEMQTIPERKQMAGEIARVLRPGGQVALVDFIFTEQCVQDLIESGVPGAARTRMNRFWITAITSFGMVRLYKVVGNKRAAHRAIEGSS
jgi:SAM-dependent methyltransferase